jgi:heat shock protein HslJ
MRIYSLLALLLLLPAAISACGSHAASTQAIASARAAGQDPAPLAGTTWLLEAYGDAKNPTAILAKSEVTAVFDATQSRVTGSAGCNSYGATYLTKGERLEISPIAATKKFCSEPPGVMDQEQQYFNLLGAAARYRITNRTLEIVTSEGKLLRFQAKV